MLALDASRAGDDSPIRPPLNACRNGARCFAVTPALPGVPGL
jgi:hypothetical protein